MEKLKAKELGLNFVWKIRLEMCAEGNKRWAEGNKLWAEGNKLCAEGSKLCAEGDKLWAEGDKLWTEAILEVYGNIKLEWKNYNNDKKDYECHLETGEIFKP